MRARAPRTPLLLAAVAMAVGMPAHAQHARDGAASRHASRPPRVSAQRLIPASRSADALRVSVDCEGFACDDDYFRTEIRFVEYVRERQDAQVHILITMQPTDGQGAEYTVRFIGREEFAGDDDALEYVAPPASSDDQIRRALTELLQRGLVRYVNHTPLGGRLRVSYIPPATPRAAGPQPRDPWNHWVLSTTLSGAANGEQSTSLASINGSLSADRTTERWKISSSVQAGYSASRVDAGAAGSFTTLQRNYALDALVVRSIGAHWAGGARATLTSSTFLNQALTARFGPAVEYNLFPYAQSTRRQLTIQYSVGVTGLDYIERTIFGKLSQRLMDERLLASLSLRQPWGSVSASVEGSHFLNDVGKRRGIGVANMDVRLFRGLSLVLLGGVELVRDQVFLPRRNASTEEILLQQRELATSYRYFTSVGLSYTFGSPFAMVVNSRFAGSSAGTNILQ